jgi:hypothetical protein
MEDVTLGARGGCCLGAKVSKLSNLPLREPQLKRWESRALAQPPGLVYF